MSIISFRVSDELNEIMFFAMFNEFIEIHSYTASLKTFFIIANVELFMRNCIVEK